MTRKFLLATVMMLIGISQYSYAGIISRDLMEHHQLFDLSRTKHGPQELTFTYYNMINYDDQVYVAPYPWMDGRLRYGKYKASSKALDDYLKSLKAQSGHKFKAARIAWDVELGGLKLTGLVLTDEKGDSIFFPSLYMTTNGEALMPTELVSDTLMYELTKMTGKRIVNCKPFYTADELNCIISINTNKKVLVIRPVEWTIKNVEMDYTTKYRYSNIANVSPRVKVIITNKTYGDCFFYIVLNKVDTRLRLSIQEDPFITDCFNYLATDLSTHNNEDLPYIPDFYGFFETITEEDEITIKEMASKGDPYALYFQWKYIDSSSEMNEILTKAIDGDNLYAMANALKISWDTDKQERLAEKLWNKGVKDKQLSSFYYYKSLDFKNKAENWILIYKHNGKSYNIFTNQETIVVEDINLCIPEIKENCNQALLFLNRAKESTPPSDSRRLNDIEKKIQTINSYVSDYCSK